MVERGHHVSVFDIGLLVVPDKVPEGSPCPAFKNIDLRLIQNNSDLSSLIPELRNADMIFCLFVSRYIAIRAVPLMRLISRSKKPYLISLANAVPGWTPDEWQTSFTDRLSDWFSRRGQIDLGNSVVARLPIWMLGITPAAAVVYGGRMSRCSSMVVKSSTHLIHAHAMDYDIYLKEREAGEQDSDTAVFIDQNRPFGTDRVELNNPNLIDADRYFARLRRLFDRIEDELGLSVVIAVHPRAEYDDKPGIFGGRRMIKWSTSRLISKSRLVIAHHSTAIAYAVMFNKPVLLITAQDIYHFHVWQKYYYNLFARALGTTLHFFDNPDTVDLKDSDAVNGASYANFMENYVKDPATMDLPFWQIVVAELDKAGIAKL